MSARARGFIEAWHPRAERWELLCRIKQVLDEYVELLPLLRPILACLCSTGQRSQTPLWARLGRVLARLTRDYMGDDHVDSAYEWSESDYLLLVLDGRYAEAFRMPATATSAHSNRNDFRTCWAARLATKARGPADRWRRAAVVARAGAQAKAREAQRHAARRSNRLIRENERPPQGDWNHGGGLLSRVFKGNTLDVRYAMRPTRSTRCCCCA